jgi:hypothetical protein
MAEAPGQLEHRCGTRCPPLFQAQEATRATVTPRPRNARHETPRLLTRARHAVSKELTFTVTPLRCLTQCCSSQPLRIQISTPAYSRYVFRKRLAEDVASESRTGLHYSTLATPIRARGTPIESNVLTYVQQRYESYIDGRRRLQVDGAVTKAPRRRDARGTACTNARGVDAWRQMLRLALA